MVLSPCDELYFHPPNQPQQLNQSQVPYPQHLNTSLNYSSVSPSQPVLNPFLTSTLIQTPSSPSPPTPSFQMPTSQDNTATLINSYLTLFSQCQSHSSNQSLSSFTPTEPSSSVHNETKLLEKENRRLSDKMVLMREKKTQQSHEIKILEDKLVQVLRTNNEMKQKIITLQHQQNDQTNLMTQQIEIQREIQSDIQHLFHSYESKKAGHQMFVSN